MDSAASPPAARASVDPAPRVPEQTSPAAARERLAPSRAALPERILRTPDGAPLAGATLSWTPLLPELEGRDYLREVDPGRIRALTITTIAAAGGRFRFPAYPEELGRNPSVVWITHPGHEAGRIVFADPAEVGRWDGRVELAPRASVRVRVTRAGTPVAGATVRHQLSFWGREPAADERRLRRVFLRELESGSDGRIELCAGPHDNAVQAFHGDEASLLFSAAPGAELELELLPTIHVRGIVHVDGPAADLAGVRYRLAYSSAADGSDAILVQGSQPVRADGSFGPDPWPRAERERLTVSIFGGEVVGVSADAAVPPAGSEVVVELRSSRGHELALEVRDQAGSPIAGASADAYCLVRGALSFAGSAASDEEGRARLRGLASGQAQLAIGKSGFTTVDVCDHRAFLPRREAEPLAIVLRPAGVVEGTVVHRGEPVRSFTLYGWCEGRSYELYRGLRDESGRFRLTEVPRGEPFYLYAFDDAHPQSETVTLVLAGEPVEVTLELPVPRRARGRVVDALTGAPVASATVTHATAGDTGLATYRGRAMPVGSDGTFELEGFYPGRGGFSVLAAGYESLHYMTREDDSETIDVGLVPMNPLCVLELFVREDGVSDLSGYLAWNRYNDLLAPAPLRADGTLEIPANTGKYEVHVSRPDGTVLTEAGVALPGSVEVVELDFATGIELVVVVRDPPPDLAEARLTAAWRVRGRERRQEARWSAERAAFVVRGLAPGDAVLELHDRAGERLGQRSLRLSDAGHQTFAFELGGERRRIRLVDARGRPWAARTVHAGLDDGSGWHCTLNTDAAGELELGPLEERRIVLSAKLANESIAFGQVVELEPDPSRTTVVTLEPGERSFVRLVERGAPLAGVHVAYRHAAAPNTIEFTYASDEGGLIKGPFCAPGQYQLRVNHRDYWPARFELAVRGGTEPVVLELHSLGTLALRVTDLAGRPIAGAELALEHETLGRAAGWLAAGWLDPPAGGLASDEDGRIVLERVPRGRYSWSWTLASGKSVHGVTELSAGARQEVEAKLDVGR